MFATGTAWMAELAARMCVCSPESIGFSIQYLENRKSWQLSMPIAILMLRNTILSQPLADAEITFVTRLDDLSPIIELHRSKC